MGNPNEIIVGKCYVISKEVNSHLEQFMTVRSAIIPGLKKTTVIRKALSQFLSPDKTTNKNDYTAFTNPETDFEIRRQIKIQAALQKITMYDMVCQIIEKFIKENWTQEILAQWKDGLICHLRKSAITARGIARLKINVSFLELHT